MEFPLKACWEGSFRTYTDINEFGEQYGEKRYGISFVA